MSPDNFDQKRRRAMVTDHAIVRYVERALGLDIKGQVIDTLLADGRDEMVRAVGNGDIRIAGTPIVLRVRLGQVVTVLTEDMRAGHRPKANRKAKRKKPCT